MAVITEGQKFILPQAYFAICHGHLPELRLVSASATIMIDKWSKCEINTQVTKVDPEKNTIQTSAGKTYTYKTLVLSPGLHHESSNLKGLPEFEKEDPKNNVFGHLLDHKERVNRNYYSGFFNSHGDFITYSPGAPYKGEGSDFYSLYYEQIMRQDKLHGVAAANSRVQFWTPNKQIF